MIMYFCILSSENIFRVRKFPDFHDVNYLVKRANEKHKFNLEKQEIESISKRLFQEIGKRLQVCSVNVVTELSHK